MVYKIELAARVGQQALFLFRYVLMEPVDIGNAVRLHRHIPLSPSHSALLWCRCQTFGGFQRLIGLSTTHYSTINPQIPLDTLETFLDLVYGRVKEIGLLNLPESL